MEDFNLFREIKSNKAHNNLPLKFCKHIRLFKCLKTNSSRSKYHQTHLTLGYLREKSKNDLAIEVTNWSRGGRLCGNSCVRLA